MKKAIFAVLLLLVAIIFISGCVKTTESPPKSTTATVIIQDRAYNPQNITVKAGTTVVWENKDPFTHDVTFDNGMFDSDVNSTESISFTFSQPGEYPYHCDIHTFMHGKVTVQ